MQGFYNILTTIKTLLKDDKFCNTVTTGDILSVDLSKKTIFPLSHIIVNSATLSSNTWTFNVSILSMDIVDVAKELTTDKFVGNNNEQDILNTQLAVQNRLLDVLRKADLGDDLFQIEGESDHEPFFDRFENGLAGWACTFNVLVPNEMTICDTDLPVVVGCLDGDITITNSDGTVLYSLSITSGGDVTQEIPDTEITVKDQSGTTLKVENVPSAVPSDITVTVSGGGDATVENSNMTFSTTVACGGTLVLDDTTIQITVNGVPEAPFNVPSMVGNTINITA